MKPKIKSFTLSEMLVVMVITAIVAGIAFTVLNLVQRQVAFAGNVYQKRNSLNLLEQRLWLDFHTAENIFYDFQNKQILLSVGSTVIHYELHDEYLLRDLDTTHLRVKIDGAYSNGNFRRSGLIDAISIDASDEIVNYKIFVFKTTDQANKFSNGI